MSKLFFNITFSLRGVFMADIGDFSEMTANWVRFSEYVYAEASDFSKIIVPKEGAKLLYYDAFSVVTDLVVDYLNLGKPRLEQQG